MTSVRSYVGVRIGQNLTGMTCFSQSLIMPFVEINNKQSNVLAGWMHEIIDVIKV